MVSGEKALPSLLECLIEELRQLLPGLSHASRAKQDRARQRDQRSLVNSQSELQIRKNDRKLSMYLIPRMLCFQSVAWLIDPY